MHNMKFDYYIAGDKITDSLKEASETLATFEGAAGNASETMREIMSRSDNKYKYQILDRMRQDCEYYLNAGGRHNKYLWGGTVKQHIIDMRALYNNFTKDDRPEWLTLEQIGAYYERMKPGEIDDSRTLDNVHPLVYLNS